MMLLRESGRQERSSRSRCSSASSISSRSADVRPASGETPMVPHVDSADETARRKEADLALGAIVCLTLFAVLVRFASGS